METVLCAAVGTASHHHVLAACDMCGISGIILQNDTAVRKISALNLMATIYKFFCASPSRIYINTFETKSQLILLHSVIGHCISFHINTDIP
jgi:hypothetical protein